MKKTRLVPPPAMFLAMLVAVVPVPRGSIRAQDAASGGTGPAGVRFANAASGPYKFLERSDWSRYENGKYLGHVYREVRATIQPSAGASAGGAEYRGDFFVLEETLRDLTLSARAVDAVVRAAFRVANDGSLTLREDRGFPSLRGFPAFPAKPVAVGEKWTARGSRAIDPRNDGSMAIIPLIAEYEFRGTERYKGTAVHRVFAKYATRYTATARADSAAFVAASGTHEVDILIRQADGLPLLLRDRLDETFTWADGSTTRFKGFTLTFAEGITLMDRPAVAADLRAALAGKPEKEPPQDAEPDHEAARSGAEAIADAGDFELAPGVSGIDVESVDAGVKLTLRDIRFVADSEDLLASERGRLDLIAEAIKRAGDRAVLVEGHTAAVGKAQGELDLSVRRAERMVEELTARGIGADRLIFKGWGGTKPIAANDTEEGRGRNRRVEFTILD